jgi:uncharacterized protein YrrD
MRYSKVIKLPLVSIKSGEKLGKVVDLVINHENGEFLALLIQPEKAFAKKKIVLAEDISSFGEDAIMVQDEKMIVPLEDNERILSLVETKIKIAGNKAVTYSGDLLGEIKDYEVDETSFKLSKIFVSSGFLKDLISGKLIIPANKIVSIGKDAVVVKDAVVKEKDSVGKKKESEAKGLAGAGVVSKDLE